MDVLAEYGAWIEQVRRALNEGSPERVAFANLVERLHQDAEARHFWSHCDKCGQWAVVVECSDGHRSQRKPY